VTDGRGQAKSNATYGIAILRSE